MRNLLSLNLMRKITLIFLLIANMIASGQISRIRLDMQLIDTINNDVSYKEYTLLPSTKIEENSSLKLHLSVEQDTLYAEETLTLSFSLSTDRWLPNRIILNPESFEAVNTKESVLPNGIHVSIKHNGEKYEEPLPVIVRRLKPLKYWIAKYHHVLIEQEIHTPINCLFNARMWDTAKDIFDTEMSNEEKEEKVRKIQNRNFGEYEIQGIFVTEFNDTIRSEVKKIWYLEK